MEGFFHINIIADSLANFFVMEIPVWTFLGRALASRPREFCAFTFCMPSCRSVDDKGRAF